MSRRKSFVLLVCVLALLLACSGSSTPTPVHSKGGARSACRKFVTARLKEQAAMEIGPYATFQVRHVEFGCYVVTGHVKVQTASGGLLRLYYVCSVCAVGKQGLYDLEALTIR